MVGVCKFCKYLKKKKDDGKSLFRFPKDLALKKKWCEILSLDIESIATNSQVCSDHFLTEAILNNGSRYILKKGTCPVFNEPTMPSNITFEPANVESSPDGESNQEHILLVLGPPPTKMDIKSPLSTASENTAADGSNKVTESLTSNNPVVNSLLDMLVLKPETINVIKPIDSDDNEMKIEDLDSASEPEQNQNHSEKDELILIVPMPPNVPVPKPLATGLPVKDSASKLKLAKKLARKLKRKDFGSDKAYELFLCQSKAEKTQMSKLQSKLRRRQLIISKLRKEIADMKGEPTVKAEPEQEPPLLREILDRYKNRPLKNESTKQYSKELTAFASTLHFLSPAAYEFVRDSFMKQLPNTKSLRRSVRDNKKAGSRLQPGFQEEENEHKKTLHFIELYKNYPILWSRRFPRRKTKEEIDAAWLHLQQEYDPSATVLSVKKKKSYLMVQYLQNVKNLKAGLPFKPWYAFEAMDSFLRRSGLHDLDAPIEINHQKDEMQPLTSQAVAPWSTTQGTAEDDHLSEDECHLGVVDDNGQALHYMSVHDNISKQYNANTTNHGPPWLMENQAYHNTVTMATSYETPTYQLLPPATQPPPTSNPLPACQLEQPPSDQWSTFAQLIATQLKQIQSCENRVKVKERINSIIDKAKEKTRMKVQNIRQRNRIKRIRDRAREKAVKELKQISPSNISLARDKVSSYVKNAVLKGNKRTEYPTNSHFGMTFTTL